ncbi:MAG TPA: PilZ domain-containing protein [Gammaproteobacteria bacterium]|nr:PilZ domain-containing protein [Gammaproteobacteria bacterium]
MNSAEHGLFAEENRVTGMAAKRAVQQLARKAIRVDMICESDDTKRPSSVIDQVGRDAQRLELDQPLGDVGEAPIYRVGDTLYLYWSDDGMFYGTKVKVVQINVAERLPSYVVELDEQLYRREEKRVATRIPVTPDEGIKAQFRVSVRGATLAPIVKDISDSGIRLSLPIAQVLNNDLEPGLAATLFLSFSGSREPVGSRVTVMWIERINDQFSDFGCQWTAPSKVFQAQIERFIESKSPQPDH